jgi:choline dehydrogenase
MRALIREPIAPDLESMGPAELLADFRARAATVYHPIGTCRMGVDPGESVVDSALRVHGIERLRVVDASVFPTISSANTNAPTLMVAQRAADLILTR